MVKILRSLSPNALLVNIITLILLRIIPLYNSHDAGTFVIKAPLSKFIFFSMGVHDLPFFANVCIATLIIFVQSVIFNKIIVEFGLFEKSTYIPQFIFIIFYSLLPEFWVVSPMLICNFILLAAFSRIFSLQKNTNTNAIAFDLGLIFSLATLIYLPIFYVSLLVWFSFYLLRTFNWREWLLAFTGLIVPFYFYWAYSYFNGESGSFFSIFDPLFAFDNSFNYISLQYVFSFMPLAIPLIISIWQFRKDVFKNTIFIRKIFQLIVSTFAFISVGFLLIDYKNASHFVLLGIPSAVFAGYYFMISKRVILLDILMYLMVISTLFVQSLW